VHVTYFSTRLLFAMNFDILDSSVSSTLWLIQVKTYVKMCSSGDGITEDVFASCDRIICDNNVSHFVFGWNVRCCKKT